MQNTVVNTAKPKTAIHVVAAIIRARQDQNKIFITQRKAGQHLQFCWEFPGGKLEKGELRIDGLQRELKEEVGIEELDKYAFPEADLPIIKELQKRKLLPGFNSTS